jgi:hypothetical protein
MRKLLIDVPAVLGLVVARVKALAGNQAENGADADHKNCEPVSRLPKNSCGAHSIHRDGRPRAASSG